MAKPRSYGLLCPIARALDKLGDRWTLLILRDLHAGPARFGELARGLPGLASNLLTNRLEVLQDEGLLVRESDGQGAMVYALTPAGERSAPILFELAAFGAQWPVPESPKKPGNLRTVVVTLKEALRRGARDGDVLDIELILDGEHFGIAVGEGQVAVSYAPRPGAPTAVVTTYEDFVAVGEGRLGAAEFLKSHATVERGRVGDLKRLMGLLGRGFER